MPVVNLAPFVRQQFFSAIGAPLNGGQVFTFQAGTSTPLVTYTDATGATPNSNPVILDASGVASIWLIQNTAYDFVIEDSGGGTIETIDDVVAPFTGNPPFTPQAQAFTLGGTFTVPSTVTGAKITALGGGGAGGGSSATNNGSGGGSGAVAILWATGLNPGDTYTVSIGPGGNGVSAGTGNPGNATTVVGTGVNISAPGGNGGFSVAATSAGAAQTAAATGGTVNGAGGGSGLATAGVGGGGTSSLYGGGGGGAGAGGFAGNTATGFGSGGGGASSGANRAGGNGSGGLVIFEFIA
jgi:hypothetical protein